VTPPANTMRDKHHRFPGENEKSSKALDDFSNDTEKPPAMRPNPGRGPIGSAGYSATAENTPV